MVSLLAKGTGGSPGTYTALESIGLHSFMPKGKSKATLTASTRGDRVFVRVNPLDIFQPMKFHMKKVMGASLDEVLGHVERAYTSPDIVGDPWKLETGIDFYEGLPVP